MILDTLKSKLVEAQKSKDALRVSVLRFLFSAIKNKEIELRTSNQVMDDEKVIQVLKKQIKMRNDSIESYKAGGRNDLVEKESAEKMVLEEYLSLLPQPASQ